jgi:hypothetical protein
LDLREILERRLNTKSSNQKWLELFVSNNNAIFGIAMAVAFLVMIIGHVIG